MTKYSKLPGIRSLHTFFIVRNPVTGSVICQTRRLCCKGSFDNVTIHILAGHHVDENVIPDTMKSYLNKNKLRKLSEMTLNDLRQMSTSFIPRDRHLPFL